MEGMRVNKFISDTGACSRREADRLVDEGNVTINGKVATVGSKVLDGDSVKVCGKLLRSAAGKKRIYIAFNKPVGITCTTDAADRTNIVDYINHKERIFNIGRLDKQSQGLIFLTNDGDIVNKILRAGNNHDKEYLVTVNKTITDNFVQKMSSGVRILGTVTQSCKVKKESDRVFRIILTQGLNRQIRRMCEVLDYEVTKLCRVRIMNINLDSLKIGQWRYFTESEINEINNMTQNSSKVFDDNEGDSKERGFKERDSNDSNFKERGFKERDSNDSNSKERGFKDERNNPTRGRGKVSNGNNRNTNNGNDRSSRGNNSNNRSDDNMLTTRSEYERPKSQSFVKSRSKGRR